MEITRLATKLLGPPEEISSRTPRAGRYRWTMFGNQHLKLYLYRFIGDSRSRDTDYAKRFISVRLVKSYVEEAAKELKAFPDLGWWMLLIGKPSQDSDSSLHG